MPYIRTLFIVNNLFESEHLAECVKQCAYAMLCGWTDELVPQAMARGEHHER